MASGCDALISQFSAQCQISKFVFQPTLPLATMLMIMVEHLQGGDRVGENVHEDVDDHG